VLRAILRPDSAQEAELASVQVAWKRGNGVPRRGGGTSREVARLGGQDVRRGLIFRHMIPRCHVSDGGDAESNTPRRSVPN
jgi:hypothetical protein